MEHNSKYEVEIKRFRHAFANLKDKRIAIYGIGRRSATLLPGIIDYNIVGLLDRDENSIGNELCGIKIIPLKTIEKVADIIIINSDPSNYEIIYRRIKDVISVPIYYADGRKAYIENENTDYEKNEYWKCSYEQLKKKIDDVDIVSFDIFDTIIMRKILSPEDVFRLLGERVATQLGINDNITQVRSIISSKCSACASIDDIYSQMEKFTNLSHTDIVAIKQIEKNIELQLCTVRQDIKMLYDYCIKSGKDVYLLSDMYYEKDDIKSLLGQCGITMPVDEHIWISCERKTDKISGSMWEEYSAEVKKNFKCLHIGDNYEADFEKPSQYGIDSYYVMSAKDMLMHSSLSGIVSHVNTVSDSICLGLVIAKLFNSPFALSSTNGKVYFKQSKTYGYCVYGPLLEKFLIWLYYNSRKDSIDKLLFFARDGFFLERNYSLVSQLLNDDYKQEWCYLPISRRLIYIAAMETESDFKRVISFPFIGTFSEYMKSRFNIEVSDKTRNYNNRQINTVGDCENICEWINLYKEQILVEAEKERKNYINFLEKSGNLNNIRYGTVDLGYYGTNQYYLQKLTKIKTQGYCFYSCLIDDNVFIKEIAMKGCFQYGYDNLAEKSLAKKKNMHIETFLTAPYGMIKYIDDNGNVVCEADKKNQLNFEIKEDVNSGVQEFISDYISIYKTEIFSLIDKYLKPMEDRKEDLEDYLFYSLLNGMSDVSHDILKEFYFDNDFVGGAEVELEL